MVFGFAAAFLAGEAFLGLSADLMLAFEVLDFVAVLAAFASLGFAVFVVSDWVGQ